MYNLFLLFLVSQTFVINDNLSISFPPFLSFSPSFSNPSFHYLADTVESHLWKMLSMRIWVKCILHAYTNRGYHFYYLYKSTRVSSFSFYKSTLLTVQSAFLSHMSKPHISFRYLKSHLFCDAFLKYSLQINYLIHLKHKNDLNKQQIRKEKYTS